MRLIRRLRKGPRSTSGPSGDLRNDRVELRAAVGLEDRESAT